MRPKFMNYSKHKLHDRIKLSKIIYIYFSILFILLHLLQKQYLYYHFFSRRINSFSPLISVTESRATFLIKKSPTDSPILTI